MSKDDERKGQDEERSNIDIDIDVVAGKAVEVTETEESDDGFPSLDELIGSFMSETSLWPVLIVLIGSGGTLGAAMLILTGVDRNPFAAGALILVFGMSVDVFIQARRKAIYRNFAKLIGLLWCAAIGLAGVAVWTGIAF